MTSCKVIVEINPILCRSCVMLSVYTPFKPFNLDPYYLLEREKEKEKEKGKERVATSARTKQQAKKCKT